MSIYKDWGFRGNPFETLPLPADNRGLELLVGRERVTRKIIKGLQSSKKFVTVEGLNGVGKTSVINVSVFKSAADQVKSGEGPLFIPCRKSFQIKPNVSVADFKREVLLEICQTLIFSKDILPIPKGYTKAPTNNRLNRWINSITPTSGGGFSTPVGGFNFSGNLNESDGFRDSGFEKAVVDWLQLIFPHEEEGAVVCVIDNLELLQTSQAAREQIEQLRDDLLALPGIRWVLCGALGIVQGVASSPRMAGYLQDLIEIKDLDIGCAQEIFKKRITIFKGPTEAKIPMKPEDFEFLFQVFRGNLRATLSECDNYCLHVSDLEDDEVTLGPEEFKKWFLRRCQSAYEASKEFLRPRAMEVFKIACTKEAFSPSEYEDFGCSSSEALRPHVKDLETAGLVVSTQDDSDRRRRTVQVVPKGWLVRAHIKSLNDPPPPCSTS